MNTAGKSFVVVYVCVVGIFILCAGCTQEPANHEHVLDSLKDVLVSDPNDGDVIVFEDNVGKDFWLPKPLVLDTLSDVQITITHDGSVLQWNEANNQWEAGLHEHVMDSLKNVLASDANHGDILILEENGKDLWKPHPHIIDTLQDVSAPDPDHGDILRWNEFENQWEPGRIVAGYIDENGTIISGDGYEVANIAPGRYEITFSTPFMGLPIIIVSSTTQETVKPGNTDHFVSVYALNANGFSVHIVDEDTGFTNAEFSFIAMSIQ